jgi:hypothetical protein
VIRYFYLIQIIPLLFILGCATSEKLQNDSHKEFPVTLIVSNQNSLTIEPVRVIVKMKEYSRQRQKTNSPENIIVDQDFYNKVGHSFSSFRFNLKEGGHRIIAETNNNNYKLDVSFEVDRPTWLYLLYLDNNQFRLHISYTPFVFG